MQLIEETKDFWTPVVGGFGHGRPFLKGTRSLKLDGFCVTFARTLSRHWLPPPRAIVLAFYLWLGAFTSFRWITKHDLSELFWVPQYPQWEVKNEQRASTMGKGPTWSNSELNLILVCFSGKAKIIGGTRLSESRCPNGALSGYNQHFFQAWHDLDLYAAFCKFQ